MNAKPILAAICGGALALASLNAATVLGTGTASLLDNDLTDPQNDGTPDGLNYDATFNASEEASFGGGENAFNVFSNTVGGGNNKWCCGTVVGTAVFPIWVQATFAQPVMLTQFTLTSGNDTPARDPVDWQIQGSNDGASFTPIFTKVGPGTLWTARDQVIEWSVAGADFATPAAYTTIRLNITATGATTGAFFQLGEVEFFGTVVPEPSAVVLLSLAGMGFIVRRQHSSRLFSRPSGKKGSGGDS